MITAMLENGNRKLLPVGCNTLGLRIVAVEITSSKDVIGDPKALDWFLTSVLTRLVP